MNRLNLVLVWFVIVALFLGVVVVACGDDDDDDDNDDDSGGDNDDDDDDNDSGGDDDDNDDDTADDDDDDDLNPEVITVPAGSFLMGSPDAEEGRSGDETQHTVTLSNGFQIMRYELTQSQFLAVMGYNPASAHTDDPDHYPVDNVTWYDAAAYANKLSQQTKADSCYAFVDIVCDDDAAGDDIDYCKDHGGIKSATVTLNSIASVYDCDGYRLPTEAEWEFAARAGTTEAYYDGEDSDEDVDECLTPFHLEALAWYCANSHTEPLYPVGQKTANSLGLYDMYGNATEWIWDWYATYSGDETDPEGPIGGTKKIFRGGDFSSGGLALRSAKRGSKYLDSGGYTGIRLVKALP